MSWVVPGRSKLFSMMLITAEVFTLCTASALAATRYAVTNDDADTNSATFYTVGAGGALTQKKVVMTGGMGLRGGGYWAAARVSLLRSSMQRCVYVSDAASSDIAAIKESTLKLVGTFKGSSSDSGTLLGLGLTMNSHLLFAGFTGSNTIGTFKVGSGCKLKFVGDVKASGLNGGAIDGMRVRGKILVAAYGDGSIQSFNISSGVPVSNGDLQYSTGWNQSDAFPGDVDITKDGHWAIFGDATGSSGSSLVEVSDISSGKLTTTIAYKIGTGQNSNNIRLSPDETLLYVSNNSSGTVTAAFFDATTGVISPGCVSTTLKNFNSTWFNLGGVATAAPSGNGKVVYVAEDGSGHPSGIGIVSVTSSSGTCTLTESSSSPASDQQSTGLLSIGAFPPRRF